MTTRRTYRRRAGLVAAAALLGLLEGLPARAAVRSDHALRVSSYAGGSHVDYAEATAVDALGNLYVAGYTSSTDFPTTEGAYQTETRGGDASVPYDAFVVKVDPTGSDVVYATYLGGDDRDEIYDIDVDASGRAYVTGMTLSSDFPTTEGALNNHTRSAENAFVTKLSADGSQLEYSAILGPGAAAGIDVDPAGHAYVSGTSRSSNYPTTPDAFQPQPEGEGDAFVSKVEPDGSAFEYSTFLGGSGVERVGPPAADGEGAVVVGGTTGSEDFPVTPGAFQAQAAPTESLVQDAFVTKLTPDGSELVFSTYLGGEEFEWNASVTTDFRGSTFVVGTTSSHDFPTTARAFQREKASRREGQDAFAVRLGIAGDVDYSTFLGGSRGDAAQAVTLASPGVVYIAGSTSSNDFPTTPGALKRRSGTNTDAFLTRLDRRGRALWYSTLYGGWAQYEQGEDVYAWRERIALAGPSYGEELPLAGSPFQRDYGGNADAYLAAFSVDPLAGAIGADLGREGFEDRRLRMRFGETVQWHFASRGPREVRDASNLDLFHSGVKREEFHYAFTFFSAGRFVAMDSGTGDRQRIAVTMSAARESEGISLRWAAEPHPGYVFDVQVKEPGSNDFETLYEGATDVAATYEPSRDGRYVFRARLREADGPARSGWSPPAPVDV